MYRPPPTEFIPLGSQTKQDQVWVGHFHAHLVLNASIMCLSHFSLAISLPLSLILSHALSLSLSSFIFQPVLSLSLVILALNIRHPFVRLVSFSEPSLSLSICLFHTLFSSLYLNTFTYKSLLLFSVFLCNFPFNSLSLSACVCFCLSTLCMCSSSVSLSLFESAYLFSSYLLTSIGR